MKNRSSFTIFTTIFSVLACFGLAFGNGGPDSPDPAPFAVNSNTADGFRAVESSDNAFNSGFGWFSLFNNTDAFFNTGVGAGTLFLNDGPNNTAVGAAALFFNSTGGNENAVGVNALRDNDSGFFNNAHGTFALFSNVDGGQNNAFGDQALIDNVSGNFNTGIGDDALLNSTGNSNTALGDEAGAGITTGNNIIAIGAGVSGVDSDLGELDDSCYIGNIAGQPVSALNFVGVVGVDSDGKLGTFSIDANGNKVPVSSLIGNQKQAMLNRKVEEQQASIAELKSIVGVLTAQLKDQAAQIQKVSAQVEMSKPAPQVVVNKP